MTRIVLQLIVLKKDFTHNEKVNNEPFLKHKNKLAKPSSHTHALELYASHCRITTTDRTTCDEALGGTIYKQVTICNLQFWWKLKHISTLTSYFADIIFNSWLDEVTLTMLGEIDLLCFFCILCSYTVYRWSELKTANSNSTVILMSHVSVHCPT